MRENNSISNRHNLKLDVIIIAMNNLSNISHISQQRKSHNL